MLLVLSSGDFLSLPMEDMNVWFNVLKAKMRTWCYKSHAGSTKQFELLLQLQVIITLPHAQ